MRWPRWSRRSASRSAGGARDNGDGEPQAPPAADRAPDREADEQERARARMVAEQLEARGIRDPAILAAFRTVRRHRFVEGPTPYGDHALPVGSGQTISQPYVVARMTSAARPEGTTGWRDAPVLEVGTGSGYQAAILAELGARVTTIERHAELADRARDRLAEEGYGPDRVTVLVGDGTEGWPEGAPYRSIVVTAGGPGVPPPLVEQLDPDGGRLVIPVGAADRQWLTLVVRRDDAIETRELEAVVFVPLIGRHGVPSD